MKKFIRKMNIGVLLAAVLLVGTAAFVIITDVMFSSRKDKLEEFVRQYIDDTCEASVGSADKIREKCADLVDRYFTDYEPSENIYDRSVCSANFLEEFDYVREHIDSGDFIENTECRADIRNVSIEKLGVDCAKVTVKGAVKVTFKGTQSVLAVGALPDTAMCAEKDEYIDPEFELSSGFTYEFYISPDGDSWKIDYARDVTDMPNLSSRLVSGKENTQRRDGMQAPEERSVAVYD